MAGSGLKVVRRLAGGRTLAATPREDEFFLLEDATGESERIPLPRAIALLRWPEAIPDPPSTPPRRRAPRAAKARRGRVPDRRVLRQAALWILTCDPHRTVAHWQRPEHLELAVKAKVAQLVGCFTDPRASSAERALAADFYGGLARQYREHLAGKD